MKLMFPTSQSLKKKKILKYFLHLATLLPFSSPAARERGSLMSTLVSDRPPPSLVKEICC